MRRDRPTSMAVAPEGIGQEAIVNLGVHFETDVLASAGRFTRCSPSKKR